MPGKNPLNRFLRGAEVLPPTVTAALDQLAKLVEKQPEVAQVGATTAALLRVMYSSVLEVPRPFTDDEVMFAAEGGVPLLRNRQVTFTTRALAEQYGRLCDVMVAQGHPSARSLKEAVRRGQLAVDVLAQSVLMGDAAAVAMAAAEHDLDAELTATLLRLTLLPLLTQFSDAARPLRTDDAWTQGFCPTCGAWPLLGEYRGLELRRFLRCGLCADEWPLDRMLCYVCGTRDHHDLHYLEVAGEAMKQRLHVCDHCRHYIKQLSTLRRLDPAALLVADIATLHLDLVALGRSYSTPG